MVCYWERTSVHAKARRMGYVILHHWMPEELLRTMWVSFREVSKTDRGERPVGKRKRRDGLASAGVLYREQPVLAQGHRKPSQPADGVPSTWRQPRSILGSNSAEVPRSPEDSPHCRHPSTPRILGSLRRVGLQRVL